MPDTSQLVVSSSPHYHTRSSVRKIMFTVILALMPVIAVSVSVFGLRSLAVIGTCGMACVAFEHLFCCMMHHETTIRDGSALLTGILLGLNLPVTAPLWMCLAGSLIAIGLGKMAYGGLGGNPFNPALVGRVALFLACPKEMSTWVAPNGFCGLAWLPVPNGAAEFVTGATPLNALKHGMAPEGVHVWDMFVGSTGGSLGETSALAILLGGLLLISLSIIRWQVPLTYLATTALFMAIYSLCGGAPSIPMGDLILFHILSGGMMLAAFFMATDMVTTPLRARGGIVFAAGCAIITCVIRLWGSYPEGTSFAILIMNALTPLIDHFTAGKPFGVARETKVEVKG